MSSRNTMFVLASDVLLAEQKSNDRFMFLDMRMFSTRANRNKQGVTPAFIDEIIQNAPEYRCIPLYVDKPNLLSHNYNNLTHMYDKNTHKFDTDQVGAFESFWKAEDEYGISLYGEVRIPKRDDDVCFAIKDMYDKGILNFSFELKFDPQKCIWDGEVMYVDAGEGNTLRGMAIVSVPAYPESVALDLVAEHNESGTHDTNEVNEEMDKVNDGAELKDATASTVEEVNVDTNSQQTIDRVDDDKPETPELNAEANEEPKKEDPEVVDNEDKEEEKVNAEAPATEEPEKKEDPEEDKANAEETSAEPFAPAPANEPVPVVKTTVVEEEYKVKITYLEECIAEKDARISELEAQLEGYGSMRAELEKYKEAEQKKEQETKTAKATAYAQKIGLDVENEEVKNAIASFDYEKMADLLIAQADTKDKEESADMNAEAQVEVNGRMFSTFTIKEGFDPSFGGLIAGR